MLEVRQTAAYADIRDAKMLAADLEE